MISKKWLLLVMCALMVLLFVGCEAAEAVPQPRDLVVVNGTTDVEIVGIGITPYAFGLRISEPEDDFHLFGEDALEVGEDFSIVLSPFIYRIDIRVRYENDGMDYPMNKLVIIDYPEVSESPVTITLINDGNIDFPGYTIEVTGDYLVYDVPDVS
ncbi:MAG: hypothetical protein CVV48_07375 [Spirochaetae bacterium HGW-Spirochaetae-4]|nr:MAG: hypothetical protein CVV48_07375 [Spirochaetae bacterium HGW-Spirochaetae-4]